MRLLRSSIAFLLIVFVPMVQAKSLAWQQPSSPYPLKNIYILLSALFSACAVIFYFKKRNLINHQTKFHLHWRSHLSGKTNLYIFSCDRQRFLLIENQQSLCLKVLSGDDDANN